MNKVALGLIIAAAVGCSASTFAATNGEGQINFTGEIIDSACQVVNGLRKVRISRPFLPKLTR